MRTTKIESKQRFNMTQSKSQLNFHHKVPSATTQMLSQGGSFMSNSQLMMLEKKEQNRILELSKDDTTSEGLTLKNLASVKSSQQPRSQFLSSLYHGYSSNITKPTSSGTLGVLGGQANFLKAYSNKVRWFPNTNDSQNARETITIKDRRDKSIHDTITKVKQFQLQEHDLKDNYYYLDRINQQIDNKLQSSMESEQQHKVYYEQYYKKLLKNSKSQQDLIKVQNGGNTINGINTSSILSLANTPDEQSTPIPNRIQLYSNINIDDNNGTKKNKITEFDQQVSSKAPITLFSMNKLKESKFRTTSNLKTLMKSPTDVKLQIEKETKKSSVRDVINRSDMASDLLSNDKIKLQQKQLQTFNHRDISYRDDIAQQKISILLQNSLSIENFNPSPRKQTNEVLGVTNKPHQQKAQVSNLQHFPQSLDQLKEITQILEQGKIKFSQIKKENVAKIPDEFYLHPLRIQTDGDKAKIDPKNTNKYVLERHSVFQKIQMHLTEDIKKSEKEIEEQREMYRQREQELLLSLEKLNLSSRVDTIALQEWMALILQEIQSSPINLTELQKFELTQFTYNLTFIELTKQVSVNCTERGTLLYQLWTAFLDLMNTQLRHIKAEKNILERESILAMDKFHQFYENQIQGYRDQILAIYKESQNYKRSYERLLKDFQQLTDKAARVGQQMQEVTILYKQKCQRVDYLEKTNNNLQSIIQALEEDSEDDDPLMVNDDYFQRKKKKKQDRIRQQLLRLEADRPSLDRQKSELGYLSSLEVQNQFEVIDVIGNDMGGFLYEAEEKRDREQEALINADHFTEALRGDYFKDIQIQVRQRTSASIQTLKPQLTSKSPKSPISPFSPTTHKSSTLRLKLIQQPSVNVNDTQDYPRIDDEFYQYLLDEGHIKNIEQQIGEDLIMKAEIETWVNEDILFKDTGINVRSDDQQKFIDRISELEAEVAQLQKDLSESQMHLDFQTNYTSIQKDQIQQLERELIEKQQLIDKQCEDIEYFEEEINTVREDKQKYEQKCERLKEKLETQIQENKQLEFKVEKQRQLLEAYDSNNTSQQMLDQESHLKGMPRSKGRGKHKKNTSEMSKQTEGSADYGNEYYDENNNLIKIGRRKVSKGNFSSFLANGSEQMRQRFRFMEFQLGRRQERKQRIHPSQIAFEKFKKKSKIQNIMPKTLLLKTITQTYLDLQELNKTARMPPLLPYVYDQMMHKYGIKKIGLQKFMQLLGTTIKMANQCLRISVFGRLMRLIKPCFDATDIKTYIEVSYYLQNLNIGLKIDNQDSDDQHFTPFVRAQECIRIHFESKVPIDEWSELRKRLDALKKTDPKGINKQGVIEVDEFIEMVIQQYHRLETLAAEKVHELYLAADFNGNAFLSFEEFLYTYRTVVKGNMGKEYGALIFADYMEEVYDQENKMPLYGISYDSFLQLALELDILKVKDQNQFLLPLNLEKQFGDLLQTYWKKEKVWKSRLTFLQLQNDEWMENLELLNKQIKQEEYPKRILLLRAKIIEEETKNLVIDHYLDQYFPGDLNAFVKVGVDDAYTKDYSERNVYSKEQIKEKKQQAGLLLTEPLQSVMKKEQSKIIPNFNSASNMTKDFIIEEEPNSALLSPSKKKKKKKGKKNSVGS